MSTGKIKATAAEVEDGTLGACLACGERADGVEPDARKYVCTHCKEREVYGLQELLLMGRLDIFCEE